MVELNFPMIIEAWGTATCRSWTSLARELGVTQQTLLHWRRGYNLPSRNTAERLAKILGREDLVDLIERDHAVLRLRRRQGRDATFPYTPTPRTLVIPRDEAAS